MSTITKNVSDLDAIKMSFKNFYKVTKTNALDSEDYDFIIKRDDLKNLIRDSDADVMVKLRLMTLSPARFNHLLCLCEYIDEDVTHIEGCGADYEVHTSDMCKLGVEIDFTSDVNLVTSKEQSLAKNFISYEVIVIEQYRIKVDFKFDNFDDEIKFTPNLSLLLECKSIMKECKDAPSKYKISKNVKSKVSIQHDNLLDIPTWSSESQYAAIIKIIESNYSTNKKSFETTVNSATSGDTISDTPLVKALKFASDLEPKSGVYAITLSDVSFEATKIDTSDMNIPFCKIKDYDLIVAPAKNDKCFRALFSDDLIGNYSDVRERLELKRNSGGIKYTKSFKQKKKEEQARLYKLKASEEITERFNVEKIVEDYETLIQEFEEPVGDLKRTTIDMAVDRIDDEMISDVISVFADTIKRTKAFSIASHDAEIAKSVMLSQRHSPRTNEYRLSKNGDFNSYTVTQVTSPNDSFKSCQYFVIYEPTSISPMLNSTDEIVRTKMYSMNRNQCEWKYKCKELLFSMAFSIYESNQHVIDTMTITECFLMIYQNKNTFSQIAETARHLFVTSTSGRDVVGTIFSKKILPILKLTNLYQVIYILRMIKMSETIASFHELGKIDTIMGKNFCIYGPLTSIPCKSFESVINSCYSYVAFNKFSTEKLAREAKVYSDLLDEKSIYDMRKNEVKKKQELLSNKTSNQLLTYLKKNRSELIAEMTNDLISGPDRFKFNIVMIIALSCKAKSICENKRVDVEDISKSPIESCTMRGGMRHDSDKSFSRATKAADMIISGIERQTGKKTCEVENVSIYSLKAIDMLQGKREPYKNRIVDKDQVGNRDISVLNYEYRIGSLFCETVSKSIAKFFPEDVLNDPKKTSRFSEVVSRNLEDDEIDDTNDQSRWGPNALMFVFACIFKGIIQNDDIRVMFMDTLSRITEKKMLVPDKVFNYIATTGSYNENSTLGKLIDRIGKADGFIFEFSMGQGILHQTSSLFHTISNYLLSDLLNEFGFAIVLAFLVTSDDCFRRIKKLSASFNFIEKFITCFMGLANIIRNPTKSFMSKYIGEFNSEFYSSGRFATPTIKKMIGDVSVGSGVSMFTDIISATSTGVTALAEGATIAASDVIACASLSLTLEQWSYYEGESQNGVLNGGLPSINSLVAMSTGMVGILSMSDEENNVISACSRYFKEEAVEVKSSLTSRSLNKVRTGTIHLAKDISGLVNLLTYKADKLRLFHHLKKQHPTKAYVDRFKAAGSNLVAHLKCSVSSLNNTTLNKDEFKRYTDPKVSYDKPCYLIRSTEQIISRKQIPETLKKMTFDRPAEDDFLIDVIKRAINRAKNIRVVYGNSNIKRRSKDTKTFPNNVIVENILESSKLSVMEEVFSQTTNLDFESSLKLANNVVNALYNSVPVSIKLRGYFSRLTNPGVAITSIMRKRSLKNVKRSAENISFAKSDIAYTINALELKEDLEKVSEVSMNCYKRPEKRIKIDWRPEVTSIVIKPKRDFTRFENSELIAGAAKRRKVYMSAESIISLAESKRLFSTEHFINGCYNRLFYDVEDKGKFFRIQSVKIIGNTKKYLHYVFGPDSSPIELSIRNTTIDPSEIIYCELNSNLLVSLCESCPIIFASHERIEIPVKLVNLSGHLTKDNLIDSIEVFDDFGSIEYTAPLAIKAKVQNEEDFSINELIGIKVIKMDQNVKDDVCRILALNTRARYVNLPNTINMPEDLSSLASPVIKKSNVIDCSNIETVLTEVAKKSESSDESSDNTAIVLAKERKEVLEAIRLSEASSAVKNISRNSMTSSVARKRPMDASDDESEDSFKKIKKRKKEENIKNKKITEKISTDVIESDLDDRKIEFIENVQGTNFKEKTINTADDTNKKTIEEAVFLGKTLNPDDFNSVEENKNTFSLKEKIERANRYEQILDLHEIIRNLDLNEVFKMYDSDDVESEQSEMKSTIATEKISINKNKVRSTPVYVMADYLDSMPIIKLKSAIAGLLETYDNRSVFYACILGNGVYKTS